MSETEKPKYASGGYIPGGTERSALWNGGYVVPNATLQRLGVQALDALNRKAGSDD